MWDRCRTFYQVSAGFMEFIGDAERAGRELGRGTEVLAQGGDAPGRQGFEVREHRCQLDSS